MEHDDSLRCGCGAGRRHVGASRSLRRGIASLGKTENVRYDRRRLRLAEIRMRRHRRTAPYSRTSFANLFHQMRDGGIIAVILFRDIDVRGPDIPGVELVTGQAVSTLDQSSANGESVLASAACVARCRQSIL